MKIWLLRSMTELTSRKWISKLTGAFAQSSLSRVFIKSFAKTYNIKVMEAEKPLDQYRSLNEFFTRRLKPNARDIDVAPHVLVSPVDAVIASCGSIEKGTIINVKGQDYSIADLLADEQRSKAYHHGYYFVLYLSPTDYHRIHAPVSGSIVHKVHLPGKVYPVNQFGLTHMKLVLSRNERLITYIEHGKHTLAAVKVGALNVSSIQYVDHNKVELERGEELAYFAFGSTVVLLTEDNSFVVDENIKSDMKVRMGQRLGMLKGNE